MTDLDAAIRARLEDFCVSDMCAEAGKAALTAVLDLHKPGPATHGHENLCGHCSNPASGHFVHDPCPTVHAIAKALGIEA